MRSYTGPTFRILVCSTLIGAALVTVAQTAFSVTCQNWNAQPKSTGDGDNVLYAVETGTCLAWAVGYSTDGGQRQTLIEKWDGRVWGLEKISNSGNVITGAIAGGTLYDLAATSTKDAWAVGYKETVGAVGPASLFVHWNGKKWLRYQTPLDDPIFESEILGVSGNSSSNYWAVGQWWDSSEEEYRPVTFHWNGRKQEWKEIKIKLPESLVGINASLNAVVATRSGPTFAVGTYSGIGGDERTLIFRWGGVQGWKRMTSPHGGTEDRLPSALLGVTGINGSDVWAVGYTTKPNATPETTLPLALHWDGSKWKATTTNIAGSDHVFTDVERIPGGYWAVGYDSAVPQILVSTWNGREKYWYPLASPKPGSESRLFGVDARSNQDVWAVGSYRETQGGPLKTFAVHGGYCC